MRKSTARRDRSGNAPIAFMALSVLALQGSDIMA